MMKPTITSARTKEDSDKLRVKGAEIRDFPGLAIFDLGLSGNDGDT